jgi:hypothetical protein
MHHGRKIFFAFSLLLALLLCAALAHSGLGQCAICDCKVFTGGKTANWWCTTCKHHYDQHYNNRKGPPAGVNCCD